MARRAERLFEIIQILRGSGRPMTAAAIAERLEVVPRTVYRDIAVLQARRVPIEGAAGVGYVLRPGFHMPPLMLTVEEVEAVAAGVRLVRRIRDATLQEAAASVLAKIAALLPGTLGPQLSAAPVYVSDGSAATPTGVDPAAVRRAIRERRKLRIAYRDAAGRASSRVVRPIAMAYYVDASLLAAWCELRCDMRHFRMERIEAAETLDERFADDGGRLLAAWLAAEKDRTQAAGGPPD
ncbi:transcriptional regulator [Allostella vacuolata]|nr:transcriptional regulator [Stella vacuolata]